MDRVHNPNCVVMVSVIALKQLGYFSRALIVDIEKKIKRQGEHVYT